MDDARTARRFRHVRAAPRSTSALIGRSVLVCALVGGLLGGLFAGVAGVIGVAGITGGRWPVRLSGARPALAPDAAARPLARPAPAPSGTGGYRFLETEDDGSGHPVRWDPCRPIHYVIRPDGASPAGLAAVQAAITRVEQVTGLRFADDGTTTEAPRADRPAMDRPRYGDRWSPVLISWTTPAEFPPMSGYAGLGGPESIPGAAPGQRRYVTGVVLLNRDNLDQVEHWDHGRDRVQSIVEHEFGHLVGLDHVRDPAELMYPQPTGDPDDYAAGDLRGLAALSGGPCFRDY